MGSRDAPAAVQMLAFCSRAGADTIDHKHMEHLSARSLAGGRVLLQKAA